MNDLIFQLHTPEEFRYLSSVGHWIAGYIFLSVSAIAFLQTIGFLKTKKYLWPAIVVIASIFTIPYFLLHHGIDQLGRVWQVITLDPQQKQHFIMFNLLFIAGVVELLVSLKKIKGKIWQSVWPGMFVIIGYMFLTHPQHGTAQAQSYTVPYHTTLGTLLMITGVLKAVEVIWSQKYKLITYGWIIFLFIASVMLITYNEPEGSYQIDHSTSLEINHSPESSTTDKPGFIEGLQKREFKGGEINIEETLAQSNSYKSYIFSYPSDNLKIYGMMNVPDGDGPFPVIVLNHGYFSQTSFQSGDGTHSIADILAAKGYLTLASDYRGFGKSENDPGGSRGHNPNYAIDILNLIASVKSLSIADTNRIGMWGHSMGGEVSLRTAEVTDKVKAIVLWAPTSANATDNANFYSRKHAPGTSPNPSSDNTSPINYLKYINTPISLHQGLTDTEVKPEWSKSLNEALKKEGKTVEYFEYEGQDHNFRNLGWDRISKRTVDFYNEYLKEI